MFFSGNFRVYSFSSLESESGSASDVSVATNPTTTFASSSASSFHYKKMAI